MPPCLSLTLPGLAFPRRLSPGSPHRRGDTGDGGGGGHHGDGAPRGSPAHGHALRSHEEHLRGHCDPRGGTLDIHRGGESEAKYTLTLRVLGHLLLGSKISINTLNYSTGLNLFLIIQHCFKYYEIN